MSARAGRARRAEFPCRGARAGRGGAGRGRRARRGRNWEGAGEEAGDGRGAPGLP